MSVPSYDDLTPGIPDVIDAENVDQLVLFLKPDLHRRSGDPEIRRHSQKDKNNLSCSLDLLNSCLFACLRLHAIPGDLEPLLAIARDFSPRVRRAGDGEVLLDVSGLGRLIGPADEIARQLARALCDARVAASVAIAPTQTAARLLAHAGETVHGSTLRHKDHKAHKDHEQQINRLCDLCDLRGLCAGACGRGPWTQLPVQWLQELERLPPAMNDRDRARPYETFQRWGIATLGELAALPAADLSSRLGRRGVALQRLARGLDPAPFVPDADTPRYLGRLELEWPIDALEPLSFVFARLIDPLSASLERADRAAAAVRLDLRLTDRSTHARVLQLPAPMRDPRVLRTLLLLDLESNLPFAAARGGGAPPSDVMIDVVSIELDPAPSRITQFSLLQRALPSPETLSTLTARLSALAGESRVGSPVLLDSHRPDAFEMAPYAPGSGAVDARTADLTVGPTGESVLRRQRPPLVLRVAVEHGRPVHIASSRRGIPFGGIVQAAGPWRTSGAWWTDEESCRAEDKGPGNGAGKSACAGWNQDEWDVALKSGAVCRIYQDRTTKRWFFEGTYD
jgi:protein ImuB